MSNFYSKMQGTASKLLNKFSQGIIRYAVEPVSGGDPWNPTGGAKVYSLLDAVATGVEQKYLSDYISSSDIQVTCSVFDAVPSNSGLMEIDGKEHQIIEVQRLPAAGATVAYRIFVKS